MACKRLPPLAEGRAASAVRRHVRPVPRRASRCRGVDVAPHRRATVGGDPAGGRTTVLLLRQARARPENPGGVERDAGRPGRARACSSHSRWLSTVVTRRWGSKPSCRTGHRNDGRAELPRASRPRCFRDPEGLTELAPTCSSPRCRGRCPATGSADSSSPALRSGYRDPPPVGAARRGGEPARGRTRRAGAGRWPPPTGPADAVDR